MSTSLVIGLDKEETSTRAAKFYGKGPGNESYVKNLDEAFYRIRNVITPSHVRIRSVEFGKKNLLKRHAQ